MRWKPLIYNASYTLMKPVVRNINCLRSRIAYKCANRQAHIQGVLLNIS